MEPIVYIYQDHLQDFWNSGQSQCFGAALSGKANRFTMSTSSIRRWLRQDIPCLVSFG